MSALADLQRGLQAHVLRPGEANAAAFARAAVVASAGADSAARLGVYTHAYRARLLEVLGNDFPGLARLAGGDGFRSLGLAYIDTTPSPFFNVRWYGGALAEFLRTTSPWSDQPEWAEMAQFEWSMGLAFDAPDDTVVTFDEAAAVAPQDWPRLGLRLHPSVQRQTLRWNVNAIRRAVDAEDDVPALVALAEPQPLAVWRKDLGVRYRRLDADESAAVDAVSSGATFTDLCERLCEWHPVDAVAQRAAGLFRLWIEEQWVGALVLADT